MLALISAIIKLYSCESHHSKILIFTNDDRVQLVNTEGLLELHADKGGEHAKSGTGGLILRHGGLIALPALELLPVVLQRAVMRKGHQLFSQTPGSDYRHISSALAGFKILATADFDEPKRELVPPCSKTKQAFKKRFANLIFGSGDTIKSLRYARLWASMFEEEFRSATLDLRVCMD